MAASQPKQAPSVAKNSKTTSNSHATSSIGNTASMAANLKTQMVKMILPSIVGYERIAMASAAAFAKMHDFPAERIEDLKTIVAEATVNAMQHGNKEREDLEVIVAIRYIDHAIQVDVFDHGKGITAVLPKPDIEKIINNQDSPIGFGIFLIQELADDVEFNLDTETGHKLKMVLNKHPA